MRKTLLAIAAAGVLVPDVMTAAPGVTAFDQQTTAEYRAMGECLAGQVRSRGWVGHGPKDRINDKGKPIPRAIQFVGVASATAAELRATVPARARTDVIYTPLEHPAHADVVTYQTTSETLDPICHWLMTILRVTYATNLSLLVGSCGKTVIPFLLRDRS